MARREKQPDPHLQAYKDGWAIAGGHPIFAAMLDIGRARVGVPLGRGWAEDDELRIDHGWLRIHADGTVTANKHARGTAQEWAWVCAHALLHLGFGHLGADRGTDAATMAADCVTVVRFQQQLRLGDEPVDVPAQLPGSSAEQLAELWRVVGVPVEFANLGCGGAGADHVPGPPPKGDGLSWPDRFAIGLASAAAKAVDGAGRTRARQAGSDRDGPWEQERRWFVTAFPLLGALAAGFTIVADVELARSWQISVAAVDPSVAEIYVNPLYRCSAEERRFVLAHEMLHAALRHGERVGPRDPYLWNVACDYVINGWLVEMGVGHAPDGCLYDPALHGRGAEDVYDEITRNLRRYRKLATLRGRDLGDMIGGVGADHRVNRAGGDLDDFYRRALIGGMAYHDQTGRGTLPSGLVEEIRVLQHPPPPWEVRLAHWFDRFFTPLERTRSYARASRRQATTPDIPRPGWLRPQVPTRDRTFGVLLDTSGSMDATLMGKALGAVASYATARDVPAARVVYCDAVAYDAGYLPVEEIAGKMRVRGRGGTVLQPGVHLLERADDFPADGPILIVTDGACDVLRVRREHAFLMPRGARLPFTPRGEVFFVK